MTQYSVNDALKAVIEAQRWVEEARANPNIYTQAQNQLNYVEELLSNTQVEYGNFQQKHELQQASDLLRILQETQLTTR